MSNVKARKSNSVDAFQDFFFVRVVSRNLGAEVCKDAICPKYPTSRPDPSKIDKSTLRLSRNKPQAHFFPDVQACRSAHNKPIGRWLY